MSKTRFGRAIVLLAASGMIPLAALADEIVHFTNGAEMTVHAHVVDKEKQMVRLDLGSNSFIAFPMAMVDKIVNAGRDVYLNPTFHPSNQAIEGQAAAPDNSIKGISEPTSFARKGGGNRGEAAGAKPVPSANGQVPEQAVINSRHVFDPANPPVAGDRPQVVMLKGMIAKPPQMAPISATPPPAAPQPATPPEPQPQAQENPPAGEQPDSENPPDAP